VKRTLGFLAVAAVLVLAGAGAALAGERLAVKPGLTDCTVIGWWDGSSVSVTGDGAGPICLSMTGAGRKTLDAGTSTNGPVLCQFHLGSTTLTVRKTNEVQGTGFVAPLVSPCDALGELASN
jgi:hypothetical protein